MHKDVADAGRPFSLLVVAKRSPHLTDHAPSKSKAELSVRLTLPAPWEGRIGTKFLHSTCAVFKRRTGKRNRSELCDNIMKYSVSQRGSNRKKRERKYLN